MGRPGSVQITAGDKRLFHSVSQQQEYQREGGITFQFTVVQQSPHVSVKCEKLTKAL